MVAFSTPGHYNSAEHEILAGRLVLSTLTDKVPVSTSQARSQRKTACWEYRNEGKAGRLLFLLCFHSMHRAASDSPTQLRDAIAIRKSAFCSPNIQQQHRHYLYLQEARQCVLRAGELEHANRRQVVNHQHQQQPQAKVLRRRVDTSRCWPGECWSSRSSASAESGSK